MEAIVVGRVSPAGWARVLNRGCREQRDRLKKMWK